MRRFQGERIQSIMDKLKLPDNERIEQNMVTKSIERAQAQVESLNFEIRKNVLKFDQVLNQQREVIYKWRRRLLKSDDITDLIYEWLEDVNEVLHNNIENHKRNYENLDHFESLVHEELNLLLNESNKLVILNNTKLNEELEISSLISKLFDQNAESNNEDFWNIARLSSFLLLINFGKTIFLKWII